MNFSDPACRTTYLSRKKENWRKRYWGREATSINGFLDSGPASLLVLAWYANVVLYIWSRLVLSTAPLRSALVKSATADCSDHHWSLRTHSGNPSYSSEPERIKVHGTPLMKNDWRFAAFANGVRLWLCRNCYERLLPRFCYAASRRSRFKMIRIDFSLVVWKVKKKRRRGRQARTTEDGSWEKKMPAQIECSCRLPVSPMRLLWVYRQACEKYTNRERKNRSRELLGRFPWDREAVSSEMLKI